MVLGTVVITSSKYRHENHPSRLQIKTTRNMRNISPPNLLLPWSDALAINASDCFGKDGCDPIMTGRAFTGDLVMRPCARDPDSTMRVSRDVDRNCTPPQLNCGASR